MLSQKVLSCVLLIGKTNKQTKQTQKQKKLSQIPRLLLHRIQRNYCIVRKQEESYHLGICKHRNHKHVMSLSWRKLEGNTSPEGCDILWDEFHKCLGKWPNQSHLIVTLSRGKSRLCRLGAFIFLSERGRSSLGKGILTEYFFRMKKKSQHIIILMENITKITRCLKKLTFVTSWCTALIFFPRIFCLHPWPSLHTTTILKSIFRGRFTMKQLKLQGPSLPWVPCKALYQFCIFFNSHHKGKKLWCFYNCVCYIIRLYSWEETTFIY